MTESKSNAWEISEAVSTVNFCKVLLPVVGRQRIERAGGNLGRKIESAKERDKTGVFLLKIFFF